MCQGWRPYKRLPEAMDEALDLGDIKAEALPHCRVRDPREKPGEATGKSVAQLQDGPSIFEMPIAWGNQQGQQQLCSEARQSGRQAACGTHARARKM